MIGWIILAIVAASVFIFGGWFIGGYNFLASRVQDIKTQWSNILTEYKRRADVLYNLAESVKSHTKFEKETMLEVTKARAGNFGRTKESQTKNLINNIEPALKSLASSINVVFEKYPELKAHESYQTLMAEVRETEDRINDARKTYSEVVREYNYYVVQFPSMLLANWFKFKQEAYYSLGSKQDEKKVEEEGRIKLT